jgi:ubiquinone biosynthesis protein
MLWETLSATRDIGRLYEIASVLIHYGFGDIARRLGIIGAVVSGIWLLISITHSGRHE